MEFYQTLSDDNIYSFSKYREIPNISPGLIFGQRFFLVGVYSGGSPSGWA